MRKKEGKKGREREREKRKRAMLGREKRSKENVNNGDGILPSGSK